MSVLKDARQKAGCDTEEYWFHQKERELIAKMKGRRQKFTLIKGGRDPSGDQSGSPEHSPAESAEIALKKAA